MEKVEKTVKFEIEKETKHTVKYNEAPEEGQAPIIGTLYVQKWFAGDEVGGEDLDDASVDLEGHRIDHGWRLTSSGGCAKINSIYAKLAFRCAVDSTCL